LCLSAFVAILIMNAIGKVIKTNKNRATVLIEQPENCESCEFAKFCRIDKKGREIICRNDRSAKIGDIVQLDTKKNLFIATVLNFVIPLFFLIGGVLIGKNIWQTDLAGFLSGMSLMVLYFLVFFFIDKQILKSGHFLPEIVSIKQKKNTLS